MANLKFPEPAISLYQSKQGTLARAQLSITKLEGLKYDEELGTLAVRDSFLLSLLCSFDSNVSTWHV